MPIVLYPAANIIYLVALKSPPSIYAYPATVSIDSRVCINQDVKLKRVIKNSAFWKCSYNLYSSWISNCLTVAYVLICTSNYVELGQRLLMCIEDNVKLKYIIFSVHTVGGHCWQINLDNVINQSSFPLLFAGVPRVYKVHGFPTP